MTAPSEEIYVADTSSLAEIRSIQWIGKAKENGVFRRLTDLVEAERLVYPKQVIKELSQYRPPKNQPYLPHDWAKEHRRKATRYGEQLDVVAALLADPQVARVLDPDKQGVEEADPYVLALAQHLKASGRDVLVLSEERKDRPSKLSINTACGLLRIHCLRIEPFIIQQGILAPP